MVTFYSKMLSNQNTFHEVAWWTKNLDKWDYPELIVEKNKKFNEKDSNYCLSV